MQKEYDYYDSELLKYITKDWQKVHKIFGQFYSKSKETTGDAYLLWRLNQMTNSALIEMQGNFKLMKETEVRLSPDEITNPI